MFYFQKFYYFLHLKNYQSIKFKLFHSEIVLVNSWFCFKAPGNLFLEGKLKYYFQREAIVWQKDSRYIFLNINVFIQTKVLTLSFADKFSLSQNRTDFDIWTRIWCSMNR